MKNDLRITAILCGRNIGKPQISNYIFYKYYEEFSKELRKKSAIESIRGMKFY